MIDYRGGKGKEVGGGRQNTIHFLLVKRYNTPGRHGLEYITYDYSEK